MPPSDATFPRTRITLIQRLPDSSDREAWEAFVDLYGPIIFAFARHRGCQGSDAADVVQEVLAKVTRRMRSFEFDPAKGRFRTWLYTVVKTHLIDRSRRESARPHLVMGAGTDQLIDQWQDESEDPNDIWETEYRRQLLHRALPTLQAQFSQKTWMAFRRTALEEADPAQVASELGMTLGSVYVAKSRVLAKLREKIAQLESEWESTGSGAAGKPSYSTSIAT
ncbi:MAG: sigma-70 family RNA polymerase sigma factor [Verrucomicrobiae bacterium]|nr:sigma-70 family RNA polymerase sigma factor [Verrucomicrobiae bacterium]